MNTFELNYTNDPWGNPELYIQKIGPKFCVVNQLGLIQQTFNTLEQAQEFLNLDTEAADV